MVFSFPLSGCSVCFISSVEKCLGYCGRFSDSLKHAWYSVGVLRIPRFCDGWSTEYLWRLRSVQADFQFARKPSIIPLSLLFTKTYEKCRSSLLSFSIVNLMRGLECLGDWWRMQDRSLHRIIWKYHLRRHTLWLVSSVLNSVLSSRSPTLAQETEKKMVFLGK